MEQWNDEKKPLNFQKTRKSGLGKSLETIMNKKHQPSSRLDGTFRGKDMTFITNEYGEPIILYLGKRKANGDIAGEKYSRRIKSRENGNIKESHWDNQGRVT